MNFIVVILGSIFAWFVMAFTFSLIGAIPVWLLWNWVGVDVFKGPTLEFFQVWGIVLLLSILAGSATVRVKMKS